MKFTIGTKLVICGSVAFASHVGLFSVIGSGANHKEDARIAGSSVDVHLVKAVAGADSVSSTATSEPRPSPPAGKPKTEEPEEKRVKESKPKRPKPERPKPKPKPPENAAEPAPKPTPKASPSPAPALDAEPAEPVDSDAVQEPVTSHQAHAGPSGADTPDPLQGETSTSASQATSQQAASGHMTKPSQTAGNAATTNYKGDVVRYLFRKKRPRSSGSGSATLSFTVALDGDVHNVVVAKSSGSRRFDRDAVRFIEKAAPFPKPPPHVNRNFTIVIEGN